MKLNTFLGLTGHGEKGSCKFGDAKLWLVESLNQ